MCDDCDRDIRSKFGDNIFVCIMYLRLMRELQETLINLGLLVPEVFHADRELATDQHMILLNQMGRALSDMQPHLWDMGVKYNGLVGPLMRLRHEDAKGPIQ